MNEKTRAQFELIRTITTTVAQGSARAWLFGGWGLDARIGRITRDHGDIEFWVARDSAQNVQRLLAEAGALVMDTQPPVESTEYTWNGIWFSTAYYDRQPDGSSIQIGGRFEDWVLPPDSFPDDPVEFEGVRVLAMSVAGMLAMKEQFPRLRNGRPWRAKDVADIELMRTMLGSR